MTVSYSRMVALGSSFAAGPGLKPVADRAAMRSARNYAHLVADRLNADLVDATVSGATTQTILDKPQRLLARSVAPQIESVHQDADLVTVTIGGNDLGYLGGVLVTALVGQLKRWPVTAWLASGIHGRRVLRAVTPEQRQAVIDGLVRVVEQVRARAPRARVVLVDYLPIFTDSSVAGPAVPLTVEEIKHFRGVAGELSAAYLEASRRTGADLVPASVYGQDHGAGSRLPWVHGLRLNASLTSSFHPTAAGMEAVAEAIMNHLNADDTGRTV